MRTLPVARTDHSALSAAKCLTCHIFFFITDQKKTTSWEYAWCVMSCLALLQATASRLFRKNLSDHPSIHPTVHLLVSQAPVGKI